MAVKPGITTAAIDLLAARQLLLLAEAAFLQRKAEYAEAEERYTLAWGHEHVRNVVIENIVVMPRDDWFDLMPGERLSFHTVEVLTEGMGEPEAQS